MKRQLLATVAISALIGCTTLAMAQNAGTESQPGGGAVHSQGGQQPQKVAPAPGGGAANHQQPGGAMNPSGSAQKTNPGGSAQTQLPQSTPEQKSSGQVQPGKTMSQDEQRNKSMSQDQDRNKSMSQDQDRNKSMSQDQDRNKSMSQDQERNKTQRGVEEERGRTGVIGNEERHENTARGHDQGGRTAVNLSQEQRTKIKDVIVRDRDVARVPSANFALSVGATVPRTVHVRVLPSDVVTIVPEYRGFAYIVVGDQLLIIDPVTMEIVAILPA
jgi:hypothetical protein